MRLPFDMVDFGICFLFDFLKKKNDQEMKKDQNNTKIHDEMCKATI